MRETPKKKKKTKTHPKKKPKETKNQKKTKPKEKKPPKKQKKKLEAPAKKGFLKRQNHKFTGRRYKKKKKHWGG